MSFVKRVPLKYLFDNWQLTIESSINREIRDRLGLAMWPGKRE